MWPGLYINKTILGNVLDTSNGSRQVTLTATGEVYCQPREKQQRFG